MNRAFTLILPLLIAITGCSSRRSGPESLQAEIVRQLPHDPSAYTQGLDYEQDRLWESTGLYGQSTVREVDPAAGRILRSIKTGDAYFGEGLTWHRDMIWVLTWREGNVFVFDPVTLEPKKTFPFEGEGWGLTSDGTRLIRSDGTSTLSLHRDSDFSVIKKIAVTEKGRPVNNLNELEFVNGDIYANVYMTDRIVRIDASSGEVTGSLDLTGLRPLLPRPQQAEVLNGIAYRAGDGTFFVTGKYWPLIFELRIRE